jgi:spore maturation protein CgeB
MIKILVVGDFHSDIHEKAIYDAFVNLGYKTEKFSWYQYFGGATYLRNVSKFTFFLNFWKKIQYHFIFGPIIFKINRDLLLKIADTKPDLIFIYRGSHIFPRTLKSIKKAGSLIFGYNNDDPFSKKYPFYFWRYFLNSIFLYDHIFSYRYKNIIDYKKIGYNNTSLLRSYYIRKNNYFINNLSSNKYKCDCLFIGHFENDGRDKYIKILIDAGINFKLFGPEWQNSKYYKYFIEKFGPITSLKDDYNLAVNSTNIALVFLSSLNNDTYTRRVFEIVAARRFMLATYTSDLDSLFKENEEAVYFRSKEDLLEKIKFYLANPDDRERVALAGQRRLLQDGHEVCDRVKEIIKVYNKIKDEKNINS